MGWRRLEKKTLCPPHYPLRISALDSSRMTIHYSASEISSGLLDIHSKRSDH